ncbi:hypothetical protein BHE89_18770 [Shigella sp. FC1967]|nr:hypothetical protein BHE89_18770 [Shigella sp. FC1967]
MLHSEGVTLAPRLGKTFALVNTQGITGIKTSSSSNLETDILGNLILSNIAPYQINRIQLNAESLPSSVETEYYSKNVIPTFGAIPKVIFPMKMGYRVIFKSKTPLPFASKVIVLDRKNNIISQGLVTENNIIFLSGIPDNGLIKVKLRDDKQCQFDYEINASDKQKALIKKEINCQ